FVQRQQVDQRTATRSARGLRNLEGTQPVDLALAGEQQQGRVAVGHQQVLDVVLILHAGGGLALAAATLRLVGGERLALGIATVGDGDDALFLGDQVGNGQVLTRGDDLGTADIAELGLDLLQLLADDFHQALGAGQDADQLADQAEYFLIFGQQLFVLQASQAVQTQLEDGLGLFRRQVVLAVTQTVLRIQPFRTAGIGTGALDHGFHGAGRPGGGNQAFLGFGRGRRALDQLDDRVDVRQRNGLAFENVATLARLAQLVHGPTGHHFTAVTDEHLEHVLEVHGLRLTVDQRHDVDAEHTRHLGLGVQIVQHHVRHFAATQLDHHAHAVLVGLVTQLGDAFDLLLFHQLGDLLDQTRLVQLVRQLGDHQLLAVAGLVDVLDLDAGTDVDASAAGAVGLDDAGAAIDDARSREIRAGDVLHQVIDGQIGIVDQRQAAIDHLGEVVRRDVGGHTHGNTGRTVDQ